LFDLANELFGRTFRGVFGDKDKMPILKEGECAIINKPHNQHWIGIYRKNGILYEYDSFARDMLGSRYKDSDFDGIADQKIKESNCGQRTISHLVTVLS
jgi:hypothetical protein